MKLLGKNYLLEPWCIDGMSLEALLDKEQKFLLNPGTIDPCKAEDYKKLRELLPYKSGYQKNQLLTGHWDENDEYCSNLNVDENGILKVNLCGPLQKELDWYSYAYLEASTSYEIIEELFKAIAIDSTVKGVILSVDSGGGAALAFKDALDALANCNKPVVTHVNGTMASMAYWFGCASDRIFASQSSRIGSIGVIWSYWNYSAALAEQKIKPIILRRGDLKQKPRSDEAPKEADLEGMNRWLDSIYDDFASFVAVQRDMPLADVQATEADVYTTEDALKNRLIDEIGTFDDAYAHLLELASDNSNISSVFASQYDNVRNIGYLSSNQNSQNTEMLKNNVNGQSNSAPQGSQGNTLGVNVDALLNQLNAVTAELQEFKTKAGEDLATANHTIQLLKSEIEAVKPEFVTRAASLYQTVSGKDLSEAQLKEFQGQTISQLQANIQMFEPIAAAKANLPKIQSSDQQNGAVASDAGRSTPESAAKDAKDKEVQSILDEVYGKAKAA